MNTQFSLKAYFILTLIFSFGYFLGRYHMAIESLIYAIIGLIGGDMSYIVNVPLGPPC